MILFGDWLHMSDESDFISASYLTKLKILVPQDEDETLELYEVTLGKRSPSLLVVIFVTPKPSLHSSIGNENKSKIGGCSWEALLTDEMIERANRGEDISGPPLHDGKKPKF